MPTIGDLIAKWANGRNALLRGEIEELRLKLNRIEAATTRLDTLSAPSMGLSPDIFRNSGGFSVLPHECASLRFSTQAIAHNTTTTPVTNATVAATWGKGFRIDTANSRIYTTGRAGDMVLLITAWWQWASDNDGIRKITWTTDDGGSVADVRPSVADSGMYQNIVHIRKVVATESYHTLSVFHTAGANLDGDGILAVYRLR